MKLLQRMVARVKSQKWVAICLIFLLGLSLANCQQALNTSIGHPSTPSPVADVSADLPSPAPMQRFDGETVTVLVNKDFAYDALQRYAPEFETLTGAKAD
jgi:hypothetical protein